VPRRSKMNVVIVVVTTETIMEVYSSETVCVENWIKR
jgi:hypothetical protein